MSGGNISEVLDTEGDVSQNLCPSGVKDRSHTYGKTKRQGAGDYRSAGG